MILFNDPYKALVIGATGAIGSAFVKAFEQDNRCVSVESASRSDADLLDLNILPSIANRAASASASGPYNIIIDATGALHLNGYGPEKALSELDAERLARAFHVNAIGPALVLKHFAPLLAPGRSIYAKLSARLGSLSDNQTGGWYGYRASKAALNMLLHTAAIELQRKNPALIVVALQPGTVRSTLSAPFSARVTQLLEPKVSVAGMLGALSGLHQKKGAHFIDYQGLQIPW